MVLKISSKSAVLNDKPFYGDMAVDPVTTTGLTFGYTTSIEVNVDQVTNFAAGTEVLADNDTSIIFRDTGVIGSALVGAEPVNAKGLYLVTTATGAITNVVDIRGALA
jgi:hypothetical protein